MCFQRCYSRISGCRHHPSAESIAVQIPNSSLVPIECPDALSVFGTPHGRHVILGGSEEQIAVVIVLDDRNGSLVSLEQNRSLQEQGGAGVETDCRGHSTE
jgi:hypothetical protein